MKRGGKKEKEGKRGEKKGRPFYSHEVGKIRAGSVRRKGRKSKAC